MSGFIMQAPSFESRTTDKVALIDADFLKYLVVYDIAKELDKRYKDRHGILIEKINGRLSEIMPMVQCKARVFLWSGKAKDGFRMALCREKKYKGNRSGREPEYPEMYDDMNFVSDYINEQHHNLKFDDLEADDLCSMLQNKDTFIYSKDKDLLTVPGYHWDMNINDWIVVQEDDAWRRLMYQTLGGDSGDNILGLRGYGLSKVVKGELKEGKVNKLLDSLPTAMLLPTVIATYFEKLGRKDGWDAILENSSLVSMVSNRGTYTKEQYAEAFSLIQSLTTIKSV